MDISGYKVLISGASSGIGAACATAFAEQGADLLLLARRRERLTELAETLQQQHGCKVLTAALDVRDQAAVATWVEGLTADWAAIDILVNNAGLARGMAPLYGGELRDWEEMIDTNIKGLLYLTRAVLPGMIERQRGHVINIGSIAGHEVYANGNVYCATKHAVTGISRALAIDTLGTGVRVSSVDPGLVETEFAQVRFHGDTARAAAVYTGLEPLTGDDVASAVLFCATRPAHANIREMILMPSAQASANHMHREQPS
jgi:serine 3-dehydrogenase